MQRKIISVINLLAALVPLLSGSLQQPAFAETSCIFRDSASGVFRTSNSLEDIPEESRNSAQCRSRSAVGAYQTSSQASSEKVSATSKAASSLASGYSVKDHAAVVGDLVPDSQRPSGMLLEGSERRESIPTSLGRVNLRWSREAEELFGASPKKAVQEAWDAAGRALAQRGLPYRLRTEEYGWNVIIMPQGREQLLIDSPGTTLCHPAWMTPPADIYVVADLVLTGCGRHERLAGSAGQANLRRILIHELGHAVEFQLMGKAFHLSQRWHAEGFATWFETLAEPYVRGEGKAFSRNQLRERARHALFPTWETRLFRGSSEDYARGYGLIAVIAEGRAVAELIAVYREMEKSQVDFNKAAFARLGWTSQRLVTEAVSYTGSK